MFVTGNKISQENEGWLAIQSGWQVATISICLQVKNSPNQVVFVPELQSNLDIVRLDAMRGAVTKRRYLTT